MHKTPGCDYLLCFWLGRNPCFRRDLRHFFSFVPERTPSLAVLCTTSLRAFCICCNRPCSWRNGKNHTLQSVKNALVCFCTEDEPFGCNRGRQVCIQCFSNKILFLFLSWPSAIQTGIEIIKIPDQIINLNSKTWYPASMALCLCGISAVEFLRDAGAEACAFQPASNQKPAPPRAKELRAFQQGALACLSAPIHLLVLDAADRRSVKRAKCHVLMPDVAAGRLLLVDDDGLLATSADLSFLLCAAELSIIRLMELGFELCGTYGLASPNAHGFIKRDPLTSTREMGRLLESAPPMRGVRQAKRALGFVIEGSASPMETIVVLLLCLPPRMGGYGLPKPLLNCRVDVRKGARRTSQKGHFVCDALWPAAATALEYDSDLWHTGSSKIADDAARRNALSSLGCTVITLTRMQVLDCDGFDRAARALAIRLGKRLHVGERGWIAARANLRRELLGFARPR